MNSNKLKIFITGSGTDVGKTIAAAIVTEALEADYWKPIQAGDLTNSDSHKIVRYISNSKSKLHACAYELTTPASPHFAAERDNVEIALENIVEPQTENNLVIEGAGGLFVPLNSKDMIIDLIKPNYKVVIISRHYLGSINHTLLTIEALQHRGIAPAGIIFNGEKVRATEDIILQKTSVKMIGRICPEPYFDKNVISEYADTFRENLLNL